MKVIFIKDMTLSRRV